jgi:hypothetical protein
VIYLIFDLIFRESGFGVFLLSIYCVFWYFWPIISNSVDHFSFALKWKLKWKFSKCRNPHNNPKLIQFVKMVEKTMGTTEHQNIANLKRTSFEIKTSKTWTTMFDSKGGLGSKGLCDTPYKRIQKSSKRPLFWHFVWEIVKAPATKVSLLIWPVWPCLADGRATDFFFVKIGYSPIKSLN